MGDKDIRAVPNSKGDSMDLLIERDAGNLVRILMGKPEVALPRWRKLKQECEVAIRYLHG